MDLVVLLAALRMRAALFVVALATTLAAATALCLWLPKTYRATAALLVAEPLHGTAPPERMAYLQTQADMLKSENVARRVVDTLQLADDAEAKAAYARKPGNGSFEDWLVTEWLDEPKITQSQSSVIRVSMDAPTAAAAAMYANAYARAYLDLARELHAANAGRAEAVLDSRLGTLRSDLRRAQDKLTDFQRRHGIVSADAHADLREARLADLSDQLSKVQAQNIEQTSRLQQVRQLRDQGGALDRLQEVQTDPQVQRLNAELQQGEARLQELVQQYGSAYPPYQRQVAENERRRAALDAQMDKVMAGIDNGLAQGRRRAAELAAELAAQRSQLLAVKSVRSELAILVRDAESLQRTYDSAVQRFVVDTAQNQIVRSQVTLLSTAAVPLKPYSPRVGLIMAEAAVVGTLLGLGLVFVMEVLDRRVRSVSDLRALSPDQSVPLLGVTSRWSPPRQALPARQRKGAPPHMPQTQ